MVVLDAIHLAAGCIVQGALPEYDRRKERKPHSRCGRSRQTFIAGYLLVMIAEIETDLPLGHYEHNDGWLVGASLYRKVLLFVHTPYGRWPRPWVRLAQRCTLVQ